MDQPSEPVIGEIESTPKKPWIMILAVLIVLITSSLAVYFYLQTQSLKREPPINTILSSPEQIEPTINFNTPSNPSCFSTILRLKIDTIPKDWTCEAKDFGKNYGNINLKSKTLNLIISNLGRGGPCGELSTVCDNTPFYKDKIFNANIYLEGTEGGEIYGLVSDVAYLSITLNFEENRNISQLTNQEKSELRQILSTFKFL